MRVATYVSQNAGKGGRAFRGFRGIEKQRMSGDGETIELTVRGLRRERVSRCCPETIRGSRDLLRVQAVHGTRCTHGAVRERSDVIAASWRSLQTRSTSKGRQSGIL